MVIVLDGQGACKWADRLKSKEMGYRRRMQSVAKWLGELGLAQYAQRFAENGLEYRDLGAFALS
jgi:hypothetical protein